MRARLAAGQSACWKYLLALEFSPPTGFVTRQCVIRKLNANGAPLLFIEELKYLMERHLLGVCPQPYMLKFNGDDSRQMAPHHKARNLTSTSCESEIDTELSGRLASLSLRAHSASRSNECWRLGSALANMLGELARTAAQAQSANANAAANAEAKKRKLSKSQKAKIQAKQRTALAVKKKAAAVAAAAAARVGS
ncbi:hypothetical protein EVAR_65363_1 [Eumeta japonica]|uniref:Uncharacterized protein n=1 Tax=Eumeta variegata TaxID=151549 RepID=A0A4C1ZXF6_EUMVA|nr:hypothetical protein EVAR_65363_1 [Eumeta japonica]